MYRVSHWFQKAGCCFPALELTCGSPFPFCNMCEQTKNSNQAGHSFLFCSSPETELALLFLHVLGDSALFIHILNIWPRDWYRIGVQMIWWVYLSVEASKLWRYRCSLVVYGLAVQHLTAGAWLHKLFIDISWWELRKDCSKIMCQSLPLSFRISVGSALTGIPPDTEDCAGVLSSL